MQAPLMLNLLPEDQRIHSRELKERTVKGEAHVLVDVQPAHHFKIVSLPNAMNIPLSSLESRNSLFYIFTTLRCIICLHDIQNTREIPSTPPLEFTVPYIWLFDLQLLKTTTTTKAATNNYRRPSSTSY
ncbi:hypothetical protein D5086_032384 [Populus alba]|uniref:Uncharacterized protein n=1 Tax=Populus alba TaxID=43335 RepID=A0ACC4AL53_POPAL